MIKLGIDDPETEDREPGIWDKEPEPVPEYDDLSEEAKYLLELEHSEEVQRMIIEHALRQQAAIEHELASPPVYKKPEYKTTGDGWIGVDLDGTIANHTTWKGPKFIGDPIPDMVARVKLWLKLGIEVRILTARISEESCAANVMTPKQMTGIIQDWCEKHIGARLNVVSEKDQFMLFFCDDSAVQMIKNAGKPLSNAGFKVFEDRIREYLLKQKEQKDAD